MPKKVISTAGKPRTRKPKPEAKSRGLAAEECVGTPGDLLKPVLEKIAAAGGVVLAPFREPLGGTWAAFAMLPIEKVVPTPFQRDLSETHAKRLAETMSKLRRYLDPIIAVSVNDQFLTPNGRHRLEAMTRLGAKCITALVLPDPEIQYKILALNIEKAHNLREKSLEVIRMVRALVGVDSAVEQAHALEFEEPSFITLGICYERNGRFGGGAYQPILKRVDAWLDQPLADAVKVREGRAAKIERLDTRVAELVKGLQEKGFKSPYLKAFVVARVNPLRFMKTMPGFDEALDDIQKRAERFEVTKVRQEDIATTATPVAEE